MRIINVVGKIDSRALVYPLMRGLSLYGMTGVISDDGAYRRLYHGKGNTGEVSGINIAVTSNITDESLHMLDDTGINFDTLVVVSNDHVIANADAIIVCHSLDRSMLAVNSSDEFDDEEFIIPALEEKRKEAEDSKAENSTEEEANSTPEFRDEDPEAEKDKIEIPEGVKFSEVQIAYAPVPKRGMAGISLKDAITSYVFKCEEQKKLELYPDKSFNQMIAKLIGDATDIDETELLTLLMKEEGAGNTYKSKKG